MKADPSILPHLEEKAEQWGCRWAAYRNEAFDSASFGDLQFLAVGPNNTFKEAPEHAPDSPTYGAGWKFRFAGWVNLSTGEVEPGERT